MQNTLQTQIGIMDKSILRITDVAIALEDCRSLPTKTSSKPKSTQAKGKTIVSGSDDGMDVEENDDADVEPVVDDAEEKRHEGVNRLAYQNPQEIADGISVDGEIHGEQSEANHR